MKQRKLGSTGLLVSQFALGCMTFGNEVNEAESNTIIDTFIGAGGTFFDTADCYHGGNLNTYWAEPSKTDAMTSSSPPSPASG